MSNTFDVGIIGAGVAGAFATFKIAKDHKNIKTILFDLGRPPMKRRRQLEGWLGCLPNSDGKLYLNDLSNVADLAGLRKSNSSFKYFNKILSNIDGQFKINKDKSPNALINKKIAKLGYDVLLNDYIQMYPKDIHALSKYMAENIDTCKNITFSFDNEVINVSKHKNMFTITTEFQEYKCKKIIIAVGRSGWRWASELYANMGIIDNNDIARFGIRIEMNNEYLKDFNKSSCTIKGKDLEIGPFCWGGTIIPEDHVDLAISAFRSNENRWKTDKVSFSLIGNRPFPKNGYEQTDRIGKLTFILTNDRIIKEKVSSLLVNKSKISVIPEYDWLKDSVIELSSIMPEILTKAYFHIPTIKPMIPQINIGTNLESEVNGMFVAGESAGITGILSAICTGIIAADSVCK
ncbi:hypothetical protein UFOVP1290_72 [uncultured Caudovirales phage]|uniref:Uncharacterized protein n=1 Tax=uncultured Caudovirales phage TaxID=2100421 RepID=A0A6J5RKG7_9CAUD|nr:hypothetical protein UFOVP1290_72 [uncultured Caudovirales phage]